MPKYLIHARHEPRECSRTLTDARLAGAHFLTHAEWGCLAGIHESWITVDVESADEALMTVPPILRKNAEVVRLNQFTLEQLQSFHSSEPVRAVDGGSTRETSHAGPGTLVARRG